MNPLAIARSIHSTTLDGTPVEGLRVVRAEGLLARLVGLLNHGSLAPSEALWLPRTGSIHTHGMLFPIDVVFLGKGGVVLEVRTTCPPGKVVRGPFRSGGTLELAAGAAALFGIEAGRTIAFKSAAESAPSV